MLRRAFPLARCVSLRSFFGPPTPRFVIQEIGRRFNDLERELGSGRWSPFVHRPFVGGFNYPVDNPIVEEDGVKKFKLEFDVSRFKPEDVKATTNKEDSSLTVEAKYKDDHSSFNYERRITIPEGVDLKSITAKYTGEGTLVFEAPYVEPPKPEPPKEQEIKINHT